MEQAAMSLLERIETLETETFEAFESLNCEVADAAFEETLRSMREETPIRVLRPLIGEEEYQRLLSLLVDAPAPSSSVAGS
jgi:hypothetical protein